jgi:hypothetical protein
LTVTEREPLCDIKAQLAALVDPAHPKRAVWVSGKAPAIPVHGLPPRLYLAAGTLIASREDGARLLADPSEEVLSRILGYVESKAMALAASLPSEPLIVQARTADAVVLEMLTSVLSLRDAATRCRAYGDVHIVTMGAALKRRQRLIAEEERECQKAPRSRGSRIS